MQRNLSDLQGVTNLRIEPEDLQVITAAMAEEIEDNYTSRRVQKFLMVIRKELGL